MAVYFIQRLDNGLIKIGCTNEPNPKRRFQGIEYEIQCPVKPLKVIDGSFEKENVLHHQFSSFRVHNEWFEPCQELLSFIDDQPELQEDKYPDLRASEAAELLGVSAKTVTRWIEAGHFPGAKRLNPFIDQSPWVIPEDEIENFLRERAEQSKYKGKKPN